MGKLRLIVLDVLKPHEPSILKLASKVSDVASVDGVDITVYEIDSKVENVKITIEGKSIDYLKVKAVIEDHGGSIHSIDKVTSGSVMVEEAQTHQDNHA